MAISNPDSRENNISHTITVTISINSPHAPTLIKKVVVSGSEGNNPNTATIIIAFRAALGSRFKYGRSHMSEPNVIIVAKNPDSCDFAPELSFNLDLDNDAKAGYALNIPPRKLETPNATNSLLLLTEYWFLIAYSRLTITDSTTPITVMFIAVKSTSFPYMLMWILGIPNPGSLDSTNPNILTPRSAQL
ncbi:hypothetical protein AX774_g5454 [Zancudomyces culisetae]|uniref:Uncharacterized protein n=1 Tax=Zancudomyces culisetae TaxID=1213189 RepID=A0A1R1PJE1_ZANCU|nr:hypothetical protein AX774_g7989 [Zancudomyces culisetae]OMH81095.1 hypothetical protein AX774_g5454 [Zancudomyces culisetae]|eukprot:OMH78617.1 hypothetical protein AX774_g7989 [Zancudomyces culisetae]